MRRFRKKRRRLLGVAIVAFFAGVAVWFAGLLWFAAGIPREVAEPDRPADAIVVLTGGSLRLETGFELLSRRLADKLFVSGVQRGVPIEDLLRVSGLTAQDMECCITLGYKAGDTLENAQETTGWLKAKNAKTVRLVTSGYHMPRSLLEFRHSAPDIEFIPHPVFAEHVKLDEWWRRPGTARIVVVEYNKYMLAAARQWFDDGVERN